MTEPRTYPDAESKAGTEKGWEIAQGTRTQYVKHIMCYKRK